MGFAVAPALC